MELAERKPSDRSVTEAIIAKKLIAVAVGVMIIMASPWAQIDTELAKITAGDAAGFDRFGFSVAVSGATAVVGVPRDDDSGFSSGAAYVFERDQGGPGAWGQAKKLTASDGAGNEQFGWSVSIDGDTIVVGAFFGTSSSGSHTGAAYVFERNQGGAGGWGEAKKLTGSGGGTAGEFGYSVAISGDTVVIGAQTETVGSFLWAGSAYVFERDHGGAGAWGEVKRLAASDADAQDHFGWSAGISGDTVVVGSPYDDDNGSLSGSAYIFERDQGGANAWGEVKKVAASDGDANDAFGTSVDLSGDSIVIGAYNDSNDGGAGAGSAYVFDRNQGGGGAWGEVKKLTASDPVYFDFFGISVSIFEDIVVVGADRDAHAPGAPGSSATCQGSAYVFERDQGGLGAWGEANKLIASDAGDYDRFGWSVAISGGTVLSGAHLDDHTGGIEAGSAYVFELFSLAANIHSLSLSIGGSQDLTLSAGEENQFRPYLLLGSMSGTAPGISSGGYVLPLNPDAYFGFTLKTPNSLPLVNSLGLLDTSGRANAAFQIPAGLSPSLAGATFHHAYGVFDLTTYPGIPVVTFVSNAVPLVLQN